MDNTLETPSKRAIFYGALSDASQSSPNVRNIAEKTDGTTVKNVKPANFNALGVDEGIRTLRANQTPSINQGGLPVTGNFICNTCIIYKSMIESLSGCVKQLNEEIANLKQHLQQYEKTAKDLTMESNDVAVLLDSLLPDAKIKKYSTLPIKHGVITKLEEGNNVTKLKQICDYVEEHLNVIENTSAQKNAEALQEEINFGTMERLIIRLNRQTADQGEILKQKDNDLKKMLREVNEKSVLLTVQKKYYDKQLAKVNKSLKAQKAISKRLQEEYREKKGLDLVEILDLKRSLERKENQFNEITSKVDDLQTILSATLRQQVENVKHQINGSVGAGSYVQERPGESSAGPSNTPCRSTK